MPYKSSSIYYEKACALYNYIACKIEIAIDDTKVFV